MPVLAFKEIATQPQQYISSSGRRFLVHRCRCVGRLEWTLAPLVSCSRIGIRQGLGLNEGWKNRKDRRLEQRTVVVDKWWHESQSVSVLRLQTDDVLSEVTQLFVVDLRRDKDRHRYG